MGRIARDIPSAVKPIDPAPVNRVLKKPTVIAQSERNQRPDSIAHEKRTSVYSTTDRKLVGMYEAHNTTQFD